MTLKTDAIGRSWDPASFEIEAERITQYADAVDEQSPVHRDADAAREAGFRDLVAPPMFAVVYSSVAMGPAILDPEVGMNFAAMVHGGQEFEWGEPVCAGDTITTTVTCKRHLRARRQGLLRLRVGVAEPGRSAGRESDLDQHRPRGLRESEAQRWARTRSATRFPSCM